MMTDRFDPFDLAGLNLTNRMIMAPMTRTRADDAGVPTDSMREYYMQRASAGLIVTECTAVRPDSAGIIHAPGAYDAAQEAGWRKITDAVHAAGGRIYLQIWHGGRISHPSLQPDGAPPIAPSAIAAAGFIFTAKGRVPYEAPRALETSVRDIQSAHAPVRAAYPSSALHFFTRVLMTGAPWSGQLPGRFSLGANRRNSALNI
jgi:N-ethylmaleimide reductase